MASKVEVLLVDDVDGGKADETVAFALDGTNYEIDLASDKAEQLRAQLGTFIGHARKIGRAGAAPRGRRSAPAASSAQSDPTAVRQWARENGFEVSDRGRVSSNILKAYAEAH